MALAPDPDDEPRAQVAARGLRSWLGGAKWWLAQRLERRAWRLQGVRLHPTAVVSNVRFRGRAVVEARCRIRGNPRIEVGRDVYLGPHVQAQGEIELGDGAWVGPGVVFWGRDHGIEPGIPIRTQPHRTEPIRVGPGAWIGPRSILLRGVRIGAGATVGAGSVCTRDVAPGAVVRGSPARPVAGPGGAA